MTEQLSKKARYGYSEKSLMLFDNSESGDWFYLPREIRRTIYQFLEDQKDYASLVCLARVCRVVRVECYPYCLNSSVKKVAFSLGLHSLSFLYSFIDNIYSSVPIDYIFRGSLANDNEEIISNISVSVQRPGKNTSIPQQINNLIASFRLQGRENAFTECEETVFIDAISTFNANWVDHYSRHIPRMCYYYLFSQIIINDNPNAFEGTYDKKIIRKIPKIVSRGIYNWVPKLIEKHGNEFYTDVIDLIIAEGGPLILGKILMEPKWLEVFRPKLDHDSLVLSIIKCSSRNTLAKLNFVDGFYANYRNYYHIAFEQGNLEVLKYYKAKYGLIRCLNTLDESNFKRFASISPGQHFHHKHLRTLDRLANTKNRDTNKFIMEALTDIGDLLSISLVDEIMKNKDLYYGDHNAYRSRFVSERLKRGNISSDTITRYIMSCESSINSNANLIMYLIKYNFRLLLTYQDYLKLASSAIPAYKYGYIPVLFTKRGVDWLRRIYPKFIALSNIEEKTIPVLIKKCIDAVDRLEKQRREEYMTIGSFLSDYDPIDPDDLARYQ